MRYIVPLSFRFASLLLFIHRVHGTGIQFITPAAGATWPAGPITATWQDAGGDPDMSDLVSYTMELIVGGNTAQNAKVLQTLGSADASVAAGKVEDTIAANVAQSVENGFYLMMTSNTTTGNQVINYSNRFTLINMNGSTDAVYLDGANAAAGATDVPAAQYNVISPVIGTSSAPAPTSTSTGPSASSTVTTTATPSPSSSPTDGSGFATNTIVGLAIGLLVAITLFAGMTIWALIRWRRTRRQRVQRISKATFLGGKVELPASSGSLSPGDAPAVELSPTAERHEVDGFDKFVEADGTRDIVYELEGDWTGWEAASGRRSQAYDPTR